MDLIPSSSGLCDVAESMASITGKNFFAIAIARLRVADSMSSVARRRVFSNSAAKRRYLSVNSVNWALSFSMRSASSISESGVDASVSGSVLAAGVGSFTETASIFTFLSSFIFYTHCFPVSCGDASVQRPRKNSLAII